MIRIIRKTNQKNHPGGVLKFIDLFREQFIETSYVCLFGLHSQTYSKKRWILYSLAHGRKKISWGIAIHRWYIGMITYTDRQ